MPSRACISINEDGHCYTLKPYRQPFRLLDAELHKKFKMLEWFGTVKDPPLLRQIYSLREHFGDLQKFNWTSSVLLPNGTEMLLRFQGLTEVCSSSSTS